MTNEAASAKVTLIEAAMRCDSEKMAHLTPAQVAWVREQLEAMPYADPDGARMIILRMALADRARFVEQARAVV